MRQHCVDNLESKIDRTQYKDYPWTKYTRRNKIEGGGMGQREVRERDGKRVYGTPLDLTDPKVYKAFCKQYAKDTTPALEAVDRHQAESMEKAFIKVIR